MSKVLLDPTPLDWASLRHRRHLELEVQGLGELFRGHRTQKAESRVNGYRLTLQTF